MTFETYDKFDQYADHVLGTLDDDAEGFVNWDDIAGCRMAIATLSDGELKALHEGFTKYPQHEFFTTISEAVHEEYAMRQMVASD